MNVSSVEAEASGTGWKKNSGQWQCVKCFNIYKNIYRISDLFESKPESNQFIPPVGVLKEEVKRIYNTYVNAHSDQDERHQKFKKDQSTMNCIAIIHHVWGDTEIACEDGTFIWRCCGF